MNKYGTRFKDRLLEKQYLIHKVKVIQFPVLTYLTIGGCILLLANTIVNLVDVNYTNALITGGVMTYLLFQYMVLRKYEALKLSYCNLALMMTNFASLVFEIIIYPSYDYYDGYLLGSNQMLVHTILMFACNLELGIFSNMVLTIVRVVIVVEDSDNLSAQQYFYSIIVTLSFMVIQYQIEKQYRQSFLLQFKDNSWEILVPLLLKKPFFIFTFNRDTYMYETIMSSQKEFFNSEKPLSTFLFKSRVKQQTLEQYLIKKTITTEHKKQSSCLFNNQMDIEYQMKKLKVSIVCCKFEQLIYTITIDSEDPLINQTNIKLNQALQNCRTLLNTQILQINKVLGVYLQDTFSPLLRDLRISLYEVYYKQLSNQKLQLVKMKKLLLKCSKIFENPTTKIKIDCCEQIRFVTIKPTLILFLFELFKLVEKNQQVQICINQKNTTTMFIYGLKQIPKTEQFKECQQTLIDSTHFETQCNIFLRKLRFFI
ncbi:unnamed protein product (macronuclear) [Paramecium tetraurelia]|uniref:Transmembrane protein n=1 Tax=Paramecium tetraurelia TaxID=5888 RepID=A0DSR8_PARTE|nr:uncharacterized protein GSPATT00019778001 [Paramecium tetraurelia]CAK86085.1 unnamed protein product [Paramecium tetraurelia]|eukprot:XP_001453482.1 hypothetical protein (macronuclear) [Paramecium tetraurelia strain d4-2]